MGSGNTPGGVAVDGAGNVYYSYGYTGLNGYPSTALAKWTAANHTVSTLTKPGGILAPGGVAVDGVGNVYYSYESLFPPSTSYLNKWTAASKTVTTLVSWTGASSSGAGGVALDGAGNVYFADTVNNAIKEWTAANNTVTTLVASGLNQPWGVAVDGAGNVYIAGLPQQRDQEVDGGE